MAIVEAAAGYAAGRFSSLAVDHLHAAEEELFGKLLSIPKNYVSILLNLDDQIRLLRRILPKLKEKILNAEVNPETEDLYGAFRSFSEDAEDVLDEYDTVLALGHQRPVADGQPNRFRTLLNMVCSCLPCSSCFDFFDGESVPLHFYEKIAERIIGFYDELEDLKIKVDTLHPIITCAKDVLRSMSDRTTKKQFDREITDEGVDKKVIREEITFLRKSLPELKKVMLNNTDERQEIKMEELRALEGISKDAEDILDVFDEEMAERHLNGAADQQPDRFKILLKLACGCLPSALFDSSEYEQVPPIFYEKIANRIKGFYEGLEKLRSRMDMLDPVFANVKAVLRLMHDQTTDEKLRMHFRLAVRERVEKKKKKATYEEIRFMRKILPETQNLILNPEVQEKLWETAHVNLEHFVGIAKDILDDFDRAIVGHCDYIPWSLFLASLFLNLRTAHRIKGLYGELEILKNDDDKARQFVARAVEDLRVVRGPTPEVIGLPRRPIIDELLSRDFRFVGRDDVRKQIIEELQLEPSPKPSVILITGMGGVGKTTLIQDILRQPDFVERFEFRKWVCVGDELNPETVMGKILDKDTGSRWDIRFKLESKKFLIVLDDCWSGKLKDWNELWIPLTYGSNGSKVVITSRVDVSKELEPAYVKPYQLGILSDEECFQIFESYAFPGGEPSTSSGSDSISRLREIGKEIVKKKIRGLPLAARVLGSSLRYEIQESTWNNVLTGVSDDDNIMSVLMWSYRRLPSHLKQCFSYLSLFPKGYRLEKEEVIRLWMAQGYVQPRDNMTLEYIGKNYFGDLTKASLIQKFPRYEDFDIYYNMHDLIHDLALIVSRGGYFSDNIVATKNYGPSNHFLIEDKSSSEKFSDNNKKLQTLLNYCELVDNSKFQLQHVRALSLSRNQDLAQRNFSKMMHLRYLDLSSISTRTLPESICRIYNLQTLLLSDMVADFPLHMWNLPNLRHLIGGERIRMMGISNSTSLQTISNFNLFIGGEDIEELGNLKELRGRLQINNLSHVHSLQSALKAQLDNKECIEEIVLRWEDSSRRRNELQNDILENLRPHGSLRILEIKDYMGGQYPSWMRHDYLLNLVELRLFNIHHTAELPPLGHFPKLEQLHIASLNNIRRIGDELFGTGTSVFPSLKELYLKRMDGLEEWMEVTICKDQITKWIPSLERLGVSYCKKLRSLPRLPRCLKRLDIESTGLEFLPEIWTCSTESTDDSDSYDLPRLETLRIYNCPSLCPDKWFQKYQMPSLSMLDLKDMDSCTNLTINYSRKCLRKMSIASMSKLKSITLSNIVLVKGFKEADYQQLSIELVQLYELEDMFIMNSEDGHITAGPLILYAIACDRSPVVLEDMSKMMMLDQECILKNAVKFTTYDGTVGAILRVEPRKVVLRQ